MNKSANTSQQVQILIFLGKLQCLRSTIVLNCSSL